MKSFILIVMRFSILSLGVFPVHATLVGQEITVENIFDGEFFDSGTAIVTNEIEFQSFADTWDIDIDSESIRFSHLIADPSGAIDQYIFTNLNWGSIAGKISGFSLAFTDLSAAPAIIFTDDSVTVTLGDNIFYGDTPTVEIALVTSHVPLPSAIWLLLSAITVLFRPAGMSRKTVDC